MLCQYRLKINVWYAVVKQKLLLVSAAQAIGGGEVYLANLLRHLSDEYEVTVLGTLKLKSYLGPQNVQFRFLPIFPPILEKLLKRNHQLKRIFYRLVFRAFIKRPDFDLINLQWFDGAVVEALSFRPLILTLHTGFPIDRKHDAYIKQTLSKVTRIICVSHRAKQDLVERGVAAERCVVVPNGIDVKSFSTNHEPGGYITWVGRVEEADKNPFLFLQIAAQAKRKKLPYRFRLVGDGSYLPALKAYAAKQQLDNLTFTGHLESTAMKDVYKEASVLCVTSTSEGLPLVILEAMASGVPIISTGVGGIPEVIEDKKTGFIVSGFAVDQFIHAIDTLLSNPSIFNSIQKAARKKVEQDYSEVTMVKDTKQVFKDALS